MKLEWNKEVILNRSRQGVEADLHGAVTRIPNGLFGKINLIVTAERDLDEHEMKILEPSLRPLVESGLIGLIGGDAADDGAITTLRNPDCAQLFIIFTGVAFQMMMENRRFLGESGLMSRNVVMFRDISQRYYLDGIGQLNGFGELIAWMRDYIAAAPYIRHVYTIGSSMGGYAALLTGNLVGADKAWAFGLGLPESTYLPPAHSSFSWDLREQLSANSTQTEYYLHYDKSYRPDRKTAKKFKAVPNVQLRPSRGGGHVIQQKLAEDGGLSGMFPEFVPADGRPDRTGAVLEVDRSELSQALREFLKKAFPVLKARESIGDEEDLLKAGVFSSIGLMRVANFLIEKFNVTLDPTDLVEQNFRSISSLLDLVEQKSRA